MEDTIDRDDINRLRSEIHPDDLRRLEALEQGEEVSPERSSDAAMLDEDRIRQAEIEDLRRMAVEASLDERLRAIQERNERYEQRREARQRLIEQKRDRWSKTRELLVGLQIALLLIGVMFEGWLRYLRGIKTALYDRQSTKVRGAIQLTIAFLILTAIGVFVANEVRAYREAHSGPFLEEALGAPYDLDLRPLPPDDTTYAAELLPETLVGVPRDPEPITPELSSSLMNMCLLGYESSGHRDRACVLSYNPVSAASGHYFGRGFQADLVIIKFTDPLFVEETMFDLLGYAREIGQTGNFSVGNNDGSDFFYSSGRGWVSFTWTRGPWIFSLSSPSYEHLERAITAMRY